MIFPKTIFLTVLNRGRRAIYKISFVLDDKSDIYKSYINRNANGLLDLVIKIFMSGYKKIFDILRILSIIGNIERESVDFKEVQRWSSVRCFGNFFTNISDIFAGCHIRFLTEV